MKTSKSVHFRFRTIRAAVLAIVPFFIVSTAPVIKAQSGPSVSSAYQELQQRISANTNNFYVYLDEDSGLNHGFPSGVFTGYGASQVTIDPGCIDDPLDTNIGCYPASDTTVLDETHGTVLRITFPPESGSQFTGLNIEEPQNWGALIAAGECGVTTTCNPYDLTGATNIQFDVRSPDGITLQFGVGSVPSGGCATAPMTIPPSTTYTPVSLSLGPPSLACTPTLSNVNVLFFVVTNASQAPNGGTVLLDNIQFTSAPARANQQGETFSLPLSTQTFGVVPQTSNFPPDQVNRNVAAIYESALTMLALLARGQHADLTDAHEIASALDYALYHDNHGDFIPTSPGALSGCFGGSIISPCGLHNAYESGDIALLNDQNQLVNGQVMAEPAKAGDIRLAGFTCGSASPTGFCLDLDGATGGNNAWAMLAMLAAYQQFNDTTYLNDAVAIGKWIASLMDTSGTGYGGYFIGYPDMGLAKTLQTGKSIENNADIFAAFNLLSEIEAGLGNSSAAAQWAANSAVAGNFVLQMYDPGNGRFYAGTFPVGTSPSPGCSAGPQKGNDIISVCDFLDANSFTALALSGSQPFGVYSTSSGDWQPAISYVQNLSGASTFTQPIMANGITLSGFDLVPAPSATGIAWEFTGQMVEGCNYLDAIFGVSTFNSCAQTYLAQIGQAQTSAPFADGSGLVAATLNGENNPPNNLPPVNECLLTTYQCIPERVGLAATNWAIFADSVINPLAFYPQPVISGTSLSFGSQAIGAASGGRTVTLSNTGSTPLTTPSIAISGADSGDFAQTNTCGSSLGTGATCTISVTFTPLAGGSRTASLTITDNAPDALQTVTLSGTGTGPAALLSATTLTLASEPIGTTSPAGSVTLTNTGTTTLSISGIALSGPDASDFTDSNTCGTSLAVGPGCSISVVFKPTASGLRTATVTVTDSATPSMQTLAVSGTGTDFTVSVSPSSGTATTSAPATYTLTITPLSGFTGTVALVCAGAPSGSTCSISPSSVTPNGNPVTATATVSLSNSSLAVPTDSPKHWPPWIPMSSVGWPLVCLLGLTGLAVHWFARWRKGRGFTWSGAALLFGVLAATSLAWVACGGGSSSSTSQTTPSPIVGLSATNLTFSPQNVGSPSAAQTVTLNNTGNGGLSVSSIAVAGTNATDFAETNSCGTSVSAGADCTITVTFTPSGDGSRLGTLSITDNASGSPQSVALSGTGQTTATVTFTGTSGTLSHNATASVTVQ